MFLSYLKLYWCKSVFSMILHSTVGSLRHRVYPYQLVDLIYVFKELLLDNFKHD